MQSRKAKPLVSSEKQSLALAGGGVLALAAGGVPCARVWGAHRAAATGAAGCLQRRVRESNAQRAAAHLQGHACHHVFNHEVGSRRGTERVRSAALRGARARAVRRWGAEHPARPAGADKMASDQHRTPGHPAGRLGFTDALRRRCTSGRRPLAPSTGWWCRAAC